MEWISINDRLPNRDEWCLFWFNAVIPIIGNYKGGGNFLAYDNVVIWNIEEDGISHWMPLPEPPKPL